MPVMIFFWLAKAQHIGLLFTRIAEGRLSHSNSNWVELQTGMVAEDKCSCLTRFVLVGLCSVLQPE